MGKFHHSKKHNGDKKKSSSSRLQYDLTQAGRRKLPEDFLYTQNHKSIWNSFSNFLDEKFAEEDLSEILMRSQGLRPLQQFHQCCNSSHKLQERLNRKSQSGRTITLRQVLHRKRGTVFRRNQEARSEIQSSNCVSAQAHWCPHQPWYASVPQVGPDQAPRPRDQIQETATVLQRTMGPSLVVRFREDQSRSHEYAGRWSRQDGASTSRTSTTSTGKYWSPPPVPTDTLPPSRY